MVRTPGEVSLTKPQLASRLVSLSQSTLETSFKTVNGKDTLRIGI